MRLIDADAKIDDLIERYCKECNKRRGIKGGKYRVIYEIGEAPCRACEVDDIKAELEEAPTIDRPQGEWKPFDRTWGRETWYCTNCKDAVANMPTIMGSAIYKYCPNCGARMKGEQNETD